MSFAFWNLSDIESTARQISGQLSAFDLTSSQLDFQINSYYQYDLPRELKIEELYKQYTFSLLPGVPTYTLPGFYGGSEGPFTHVEPKFYINGFPIFYTQDTNQYYSRISVNYAIEIIGYGNASTVTFNYTTLQIPIQPGIPSSVIVTDQVETLSDDGNGNLVSNNGSGSGTVNYMTGAIAVTFQTAPPQGQQINVTYNFMTLAIPNTVLFFANGLGDRQFTFYPCPDTAYQGRIDAYNQPPALVDPDDQPLKPEWGEIIAIGAALKILRNFGQFEKYSEMKVYYDKERSKLMSDTDNQLMATRSRPRY